MPRHVRTLSSLLAMFALLALAVGPAMAKEGAEARLDTAISRDAEPGSTIDVGWSTFTSTGHRSTSGSSRQTARA